MHIFGINHIIPIIVLKQSDKLYNVSPYIVLCVFIAYPDSRNFAVKNI